MGHTRLYPPYAPCLGFLLVACATPVTAIPGTVMPGGASGAVSRLLGHRKVQSSLHYAHLDDSHLIKATEDVEQALLDTVS